MSFKTDSPDGPSKMALAWASPGTSRTVTDEAFVAAFSISRSRVIGVELSFAEPMRSSGLVSSAASAGGMQPPSRAAEDGDALPGDRDDDVDAASGPDPLGSGPEAQPATAKPNALAPTTRRLICLS